MRRYLAVILSLALIHCGKSTTGGNGSSSSGTSAGTSGTVGSSGTTGSSGAATISASSSGSGTGSGSSGGASSSGALSYHGAVYYVSTTLPVIGSTHAVAAAFVDQNSLIPNDPGGCVGGTVVESCCYHGVLPAATASSSSGSSAASTSGSSASSSGSASTSGSSGASGGSTTQYSAGVITLTDGSATLGTMTPSSSGAYTPVTTYTWNVGDSLGAAGAGDAVPAFSGTAMAPPAVNITQPTVGGTFMTAQVSTSHALIVNWDGAGGTKVYTNIYIPSSGVTPIITCTTPDQGHVTIPSTLLAALSGQSYGALAVGRANSSDASSANSQVTVYAVTANGIAVQFGP